MREISRKATFPVYLKRRLAVRSDVYIYSVRVRGKFARESWEDVALRNINSAI